MRNFKQNKDPTRILRDNKEVEENSQLKSLCSKIRSCISQILDFNNCALAPEELSDLCSSLSIGQMQTLQIWNDCLLMELKKYIFKINSTLQIKKQISWAKSSIALLQRIDKLADFVVSVIDSLSARNIWCLCDRVVCSMRVSGEFTKKRIRDYVVANLMLDLGIPKNMTLSNIGQDNGFLFFFDFAQDEVCLNISLSKIEQKENNQKDIPVKKEIKIQTVQEFLSSLKIEKDDRKDCHIDDDWLKFIQKNKMFNGK